MYRFIQVLYNKYMRRTIQSPRRGHTAPASGNDASARPSVSISSAVRGPSIHAHPSARRQVSSETRVQLCVHTRRSLRPGHAFDGYTRLERLMPITCIIHITTRSSIKLHFVFSFDMV